MKRIFVAWLGLMAFAGASATAADLPRYQQPVAPMYNPIYNWTGFYVGINGGGAWGNSQWDGLNKFDVSGGMIGGTIGYNVSDFPIPLFRWLDFFVGLSANASRPRHYAARRSAERCAAQPQGMSSSRRDAGQRLTSFVSTSAK